MALITLNPLTTGAVHIRFLHFLLAHYISGLNLLKIKSDKIISNICNFLSSILSNLNNFHSLEVVDRVSETQLQVGENSN